MKIKHPKKIYVYQEYQEKRSDEEPYLMAVRDSDIELIPEDCGEVGVYVLQDIRKLIVTRELKCQKN